VPEVDAGTCAAHFHPPHAMRVVRVQGNGAFQRVEKTGPSGSAFKFRIAEEKRCAGNGIDKSPRPLLVEVGSGVWRLGALLEGYFALLRR
jgi:hypothetical protein